MAETAISWTLGGLIWALFLAPVAALLFLLRAWALKRPVPAWGLAAIYCGAPLWVPFIAWHSAFDERLRPWTAAPLLAGWVLAALWSRRMEPPRKGADVQMEFALCLVFAFMGWVTFGGGYFDAMPLSTRARQRFQASGIDAGDPKALAAAFDDPDPFVGYGAWLALQLLDKKAPGVPDAYTKALAARHPRVRDRVPYMLTPYSKYGVELSTGVLVSLLDSPDTGVRERVNDSIGRWNADMRKAVLASAGR